jgi:hypothetical protein
METECCLDLIVVELPKKKQKKFKKKGAPLITQLNGPAFFFPSKHERSKLL